MRSVIVLPLVVLASLMPAVLGVLAPMGAREVLLVYPPGFDAARAAADVIRLGGLPLASGTSDNLLFARFDGAGWEPSRLADSPAWVALATQPHGLCAAFQADPE